MASKKGPYVLKYNEIDMPRGAHHYSVGLLGYLNKCLSSPNFGYHGATRNRWAGTRLTLHKIILFLVVILMAHPAMAHPHIFVKYGVDVTEKDSNTFDLHFTFRMHNVITPHPLFREPQALDGTLTDALVQHPFYFFLDINGHPLGQQNVEMARAGGTEDEPIYTFDMEVPADAGNFGFTIYDPEYYDAVSLDGAVSLTIKAKNLICSPTTEEVGKTMWGINYATHIECGDKSKPLPHISHLKHDQFDQPPVNTSPLGNTLMVP